MSIKRIGRELVVSIHGGFYYVIHSLGESIVIATYDGNPYEGGYSLVTLELTEQEARALRSAIGHMLEEGESDG